MTKRNRETIGASASGLKFTGIVTGGTWCLDANKLIGDWPTQDRSMEILEVIRSGGGQRAILLSTSSASTQRLTLRRSRVSARMKRGSF